MDSKSLQRAMLSEFVGTYLLVFTVGCNVITGTAAWAVTSIACTLMVSIYAFAAVSGSKFNPAVSFAVAQNKTPDHDWNRCGKEMAMQFAGGILGAFTYAGMFWDVFNLAPATGFNGLHAGFAELFYTFLLVFCVMNTAVSPKGKSEYFGFAIGFSVIAGGYGAGHISGGCFNPAVAVAIDLASAGVGFGWCIAYMLFEFAGAALAVVLYQKMETVRNAEGDLRDVAAQTKSTRLLSEFIGTFFLVLTVGLNVLGGSNAPVWSIAASLMCVIYCLGNVSGGHFNPAVTMAISASGSWPLGQEKDGAMYMVSQIAGGIVAAFTYSMMEKGQVFPLAPGAGHTWGSAYLVEFIFTFMLAYVVLSVAAGATHSQYGKPMESYFAFVIASCVTAGGYAIGAISGGSLNPAVSMGIAISSIGRGHGIFHVFPYVLFEMLAGAFAGMLFKVTHKEWISK